MSAKVDSLFQKALNLVEDEDKRKQLSWVLDDIRHHVEMESWKEGFKAHKESGGNR